LSAIHNKLFCYNDYWRNYNCH